MNAISTGRNTFNTRITCPELVSSPSVFGHCTRLFAAMLVTGAKFGLGTRQNDVWLAR